MGGGKGGSAGEIPPEIQQASEVLQGIGEEQYQLGLPLIQQGANQALELLRTGNVAALEPAIKTATEQGRSTQSMALRDLMEQATRRGLTGTALQERMARGRVDAESAVADIPSQFTMPFLQQVAGPAFNLTGQGIQGIGQAGQLAGMAAGPAGPQSGGLVGGLGGAASGALGGSLLASQVGWLGGPAGALGGAALGGLFGSK